MTKRNGYNPNQDRDPKTGEWIKEGTGNGTAEGKKGYDSRKDTTVERAARQAQNARESHNKNESAKISLKFFAKGKGTPKYPVEKRPDVPKEAYGFSKEKLHTEDHEDHRRQMGFKNSDQYNKAAIAFWNSDKGTLYYSERRGNFAKIAPDNLTLCICNKEGRIQTYYKLPNVAKTENFKNLERLVKI